MPSCIKGATLLNCIAIVREIAAGARFEKLVAACPVPTQLLLRRTVLGVEWISVDVWSPFLHAIFEQLVTRDEHKFRRLMRAVCVRDFSSVYRAFIQNADPTTLLDKLANIWSAYYDSGSLSAGPIAVEQGVTSVVVYMRELDAASPLWAVVTQAYIHQLLTMVGAKDCNVTRAKEVRTSEGRQSCEFLLRYC